MMRQRSSSHAVLLVLAGLVAPLAAHAAEERKSFVSCPIVRDTATVPCWLAEYEGKTYFLTIQSDVSAPVTPPWLGHRVLVEGTVANEPNICGGIVLKPVHLSVLPELDPSCNTILPAEDRYNLTFEPPRPPGPSKGRLAFSYAPPPPPPPPAAATTKEFTVPYDFDGMVGFSHPRYLTPVLSYAKAIDAQEIEIVGYRGGARLSDGRTLLEDAGIGRRRAEQIAMLLKGAQLDGPTYKVSWHDEPPHVTGKDDYLTRRVVITVRPR
ncbi:MAG TPA: hypothetical protein VG994_10230 [Steroidobacteraceae bacterium]|nr:hypothetical protein [Steroidobacteraceae bacterium]